MEMYEFTIYKTKQTVLLVSLFYLWYIEFKLFLKSSLLCLATFSLGFISQPKKPPYFIETFTYNLEVNKKVTKIYFH